MAITLDMLVELIRDVESARREAEEQLAEAEATVTTLSQRLHELREEEKSFRSAMARRFPRAATHAAEPARPLVELPAVFESWVAMARTDAVEKTIRDVNAATRQTVSPGEIEAYLSERGRTDSRDDIGGATARLNKVGRIHSVGRGKWLPGPAKAPGDDASTSSPGSVPTTRSGGDEDEAAPSFAPTAPQDHDPTFG